MTPFLHTAECAEFSKMVHLDSEETPLVPKLQGKWKVTYLTISTQSKVLNRIKQNKTLFIVKETQIN